MPPECVRRSPPLFACSTLCRATGTFVVLDFEAAAEDHAVLAHLANSAFAYKGDDSLGGEINVLSGKFPAGDHHFDRPDPSADVFADLLDYDFDDVVFDG